LTRGAPGTSSAPRAAAHGARSPRAALASIKLLVLDVDGVLTDGRLYYGPMGEELKVFHVRDGVGIRALRERGVEVAIISGRRSRALARRARDLGIRHIAQGVGDKLAAFRTLCARLRLRAEECACVGDDSPDLPLMAVVGFAFAVADAHPLARAAAHRRTRLPGGVGAVREVCDYLLTQLDRRLRAP
jgi:3-deoxy-D-manno-octulosonate 8-phosphate phosphatase (KDO 8-P phosphatase)